MRSRNLHGRERNFCTGVYGKKAREDRLRPMKEEVRVRSYELESDAKSMGDRSVDVSIGRESR